MKESSPWHNEHLLAKRAHYLSLGIYEEMTGCIICIRGTRRGATMSWDLEPKQKCQKHPRYNLAKALVTINKSKGMQNENK